MTASVPAPVLTSAEENYLKAVFALAQPRIGTNALADRVQTKASSATDMLQRLAEKGLVDYERYKGVALTDAGRIAAAAVVRRHRLWEVFLAETLGFGWNEVHDLAEELEHVQSPELIHRLDRFLGTPTHDPHGDPIPQADGSWPAAAGILLDQLPPGTAFTVVGAADHTDELLNYLTQVGAVPQSSWTLVEVLPFDGTRVLQDDDRRLHLSALAAKNMWVQAHSQGSRAGAQATGAAPAQAGARNEDAPTEGAPTRRDLQQWGDETPFTDDTH